MTLIDGPSDTVVATVAVAERTADDIRVVQTEGSALLVDSSAGTISRIDAASYSVSRLTRAASPGASLTVLISDGHAAVVNSPAGTATPIDPVTLALGTTTSLGATPGPDQLLLTDDSRIWAVDAQGSGVTWSDPTGSQGRAAVDRGARVVAVGGRPVIVHAEEAQPRVGWLAATGSIDYWPCRLPVAAGQQFRLVGSDDGARLFAVVDGAGTLVAADATGTSCGAAITIGTSQSRYGQPVQSGPYLFVPDLGTGITTIVDTQRSVVLDSLPLSAVGHRLELLAKDGLVFYNDLDSDLAGVISPGPAGSWIVGPALSKYNPITGEPAGAVISSTIGSSDSADQVSSASGDSASATSSTTTTQATTSTAPELVTSTTASPTGSVSSSQGSPSSRSSASQTSSVPIPVIRSITPVDPVEAGSPAGFTADVADASGSWSWTAVAGGDTALGSGSTEGSFTTDTIPTGVTSIAVTLVVGSSQPRTEVFDVAQIDIPTQTSVTINDPPDGGSAFWTSDTLTASVTVTSSSGTTVPSGSVTLTATSGSGAAVTNGSQTVDLAGGQVTFAPLSVDAAGDIAVHVDYVGDTIHLASADDAAAEVFPTPKKVFGATCSPVPRSTRLVYGIHSGHQRSRDADHPDHPERRHVGTHLSRARSDEPRLVRLWQRARRRIARAVHGHHLDPSTERTLAITESSLASASADRYTQTHDEGAPRIAVRPRRWWRWRESNPRPTLLSEAFYVRIPFRSLLGPTASTDNSGVTGPATV